MMYPFLVTAMVLLPYIEIGTLSLQRSRGEMRKWRQMRLVRLIFVRAISLASYPVEKKAKLLPQGEKCNFSAHFPILELRG